jgi:hypothetical protein
VSREAFPGPAPGKSPIVRDKLLAIYLNDHLAGATAALELARRAARQNAGEPLGTFLAGTLVTEIAADRRTLERLIARLEIKRSHWKIAAAWAFEKVGRLKLNGRLGTYSPLSRLLEIEALALGIEGKRALWLALASTRLADEANQEFDFAQLAARAECQRSRLEDYRRAAAATALL